MDVLIYIVKGDGRWRLLYIRKEERQVAHVMLPDARVRVLAGEPVLKLGEFGVHGSLLLEEESITQVALSLHREGEPNCSQFGPPFWWGSKRAYIDGSTYFNDPVFLDPIFGYCHQKRWQAHCLLSQQK